MRKHAAADKHKFKEQTNSGYIDDGNLHDNDIDERLKQDHESELEQDYLDFPDPLEYLIGYFATKPETVYRYQTSSFQENTITTAISPKKPPKVTENEFHETGPKHLYKSYYEYKKHSGTDNLNQSNSRYSNHTSLLSSAQKPNIFSKNKNSMDYQKHLVSKTLDHNDRLSRTLGEDEVFASRHESIGRSSVEPYDQFSEQRN